MRNYVLFLDQIDASQASLVGGKGANLGELAKAGFPVPQGFCITTLAYKRFYQLSSELDNLVDKLSKIDIDDQEKLSSLGQRIREEFRSLEIPGDLEEEIVHAWKKAGMEKAYAVRSSATAEDLPSASFAGQQETYLNVQGQKQLLISVRKCWASLFTDRAISYRIKNGFDHRSVFLSVIVQEMIPSVVSGIMFTADPITGHRKIISIDASFGLGEALVSGQVLPDHYIVRSGNIVSKQISKKEVAINVLSTGGTINEKVPQKKQNIQALPDDKIIELAGLGQKIQEHFGSPQDIEWCLAKNKLYIVQSRPITTLYPAPKAEDKHTHIFLSLGHVQMMTETIKPLGISVLRTFIPIGKSTLNGESSFLIESGGRLYFDISRALEYRQLRGLLPKLLPMVDELMARTIKEFMEREEFKAAIDPKQKLKFAQIRRLVPTFSEVMKTLLFRNNEHAIENVDRFLREFIKKSKSKLSETSGAERISQIQEILSTAFLSIIPKNLAPYMGPAILSYKLIGVLSQKWLGDTDELASIGKSPPGNVTTEMGLALGDIADIIRKHPAVVEYLRQAKDETFWEGLKKVSGGKEVQPALQGFFERYGMRCTGEVDITRKRWKEVPTRIVPVLLNHINRVSPGQHRKDFESGKKEALQAEKKLLARLRKTRGGYIKAKIMKRLIEVYRSLIGIREMPKFFVVQLFDLIRSAVLAEADKLVRSGVLESRYDIYWFSLSEIKEMIRNQKADRELIAERKKRFEYYNSLIPPRAITNDGEIVVAKGNINVPQGALAGMPASAGITEGRARVVLRLEEAKLEKGDILVAPYTDPAWTPLFPIISGLVTEAGGLMTHGSIVAREYGIPAVVGLENATRSIKDGSFIRINGTGGYVEFLNKDQ